MDVAGDGGGGVTNLFLIKINVCEPTPKTVSMLDFTSRNRYNNPTMSQESIEFIPPQEDFPSQGLTNEGGEENVGLQPVAGPITGQLEVLLGGLPGTGIPPEQENKQHKWQSRSGTYDVPGQRWEPTKLNSRHREIMRRILEGSSYAEIAAQMGLHAHTVTIIATSQMFREELAKLEQNADFEVIKRAETLSNEALDVLKVNMRSAQKAADRNKAAIEILGIGGYSKIEKKVVGVVNGEEVIKKLNEIRRQRIMGDQGQDGSAS
jgi:DNA-binding NarL/FixJ family response regulator